LKLKFDFELEGVWQYFLFN